MIKKIPVGMLETNCYVVWSNKKNAVVIDPGDDVDKISLCINDFNLKIKYIILTHGHWDHIGAVKSLAINNDCEILVHKSDLSMLSIENNLNIKFIEEDETIVVDDMNIKVMYTPGHTEGSICLKLNTNLFTGDTLFCGSVGRTDLPGGSMDKMMESLNKILKLTEETTIYPGHGPITYLNVEKKSNPYIKELFKGQV